MRIVILANNWVGWQVTEWLSQREEEIVGLIVHPLEAQKYSNEIISSASIDSSLIFNGSTIHAPENIEKIKSLRPDIAISLLFDYILKPVFIDIFPQGVINLHPAYLPYNRGQYPNVWSIIEGTPAGTTLHFIDAGIDTGEIIARELVNVEPVDTGKTLNQKLAKASLDLFKVTWPTILSGSFQRLSQNIEDGTYHKTEDVQGIDEIDLDEYYKAKTLINILRARTFPPYKGAYFIQNGKKVYLRLQLLNEAQMEDN